MSKPIDGFSNGPSSNIMGMDAFSTNIALLWMLDPTISFTNTNWYWIIERQGVGAREDIGVSAMSLRCNSKVEEVEEVVKMVYVVEEVD